MYRSTCAQGLVVTKTMILKLSLIKHVCTNDRFKGASDTDLQWIVALMRDFGLVGLHERG